MTCIVAVKVIDGEEISWLKLSRIEEYPDDFNHRLSDYLK